MSYLSPIEVNTLIHQVGSNTLVALAIGVEGVVNPQDWTNGSVRPNDQQIAALQDGMRRLTTELGPHKAREIMRDDTSLVHDLSRGLLERFHDSIQDHVVHAVRGR